MAAKNMIIGTQGIAFLRQKSGSLKLKKIIINVNSRMIYGIVADNIFSLNYAAIAKNSHSNLYVEKLFFIFIPWVSFWLKFGDLIIFLLILKLFYLDKKPINHFNLTNYFKGANIQVRKSVL